MSKQVEMFVEPLRVVKRYQEEQSVKEALDVYKEELLRKLRESFGGVPDSVPFDIENACGMISSLKTTIDVLQNVRTAELNARGDLACILTGEWDETIPWSKLLDKVRELMIKPEASDAEVMYAYLPVWADVVHLNNHGMWPGAVIPNWAQERAKRWRCGPTDTIVLMSAANYEIERLQKLVEITSEERDEAIQRSDDFIRNCIACLDDTQNKVTNAVSAFIRTTSEVKASLHWNIKVNK